MTRLYEWSNTIEIGFRCAVLSSNVYGELASTLRTNKDIANKLERINNTVREQRRKKNNNRSR